jgi:hypothetical protein
LHPSQLTIVYLVKYCDADARLDSRFESFLFPLQVLSDRERNLELHLEMPRSRTKIACLPPTSPHQQHLKQFIIVNAATTMADEAPPEIPEVCLSCVCVYVKE